MPGQLKLLSGEIPVSTKIEDSEILSEEPTSPQREGIETISEEETLKSPPAEKEKNHKEPLAAEKEKNHKGSGDQMPAPSSTVSTTSQ